MLIRGEEIPDSEVLTDLVVGQGDIWPCGCGWPVTELDGEYFHVFNDRLIGTDDHDPEPP